MNKKIILIAGIILFIALISVGIFIVVKNKKDKENEIGSISFPFPQEYEETKLSEYIQKLGDNYSIKYSGTFKNNEGKDIKTVIEYTKDKENFAIKSSDLDLHVVCADGVVNSVSNRWKAIIEMPERSFDSYRYNLILNAGQTYLRHFATKENKITYYVEEYKYKEDVVQYYFLEDTVKFVKVNDNKIDIIRVENVTNKDLFTLPKGYAKAIT